LCLGLAWRDVSERRKFFDQLAHDLGFSPLDSQKWYGISGKNVWNKKVILVDINYLWMIN
jgi:hypothetical protein